MLAIPRISDDSSAVCKLLVLGRIMAVYRRNNRYRLVVKILIEPTNMKKTIILSAVAVAISGAAHAQFSYNNGDLLIGFRSSTASKDLVVDIGPATSYASGSSRVTLSGTYFTSSQLTYALGSPLDGADFSAFADDAGSDTLWVTAPRAPFFIKSNAWTPQSDNNQTITESKIEGIGIASGIEGGQLAATANNTATAIAIPNTLSISGGSSYSKGVLSVTGSGIPTGNFRGTFQGNVENTLPTGFATGGTPVISDLYSLVPSAGSAGYLGYFTFLPSGTFTFTPSAFSIPQPTLSITSSGGVNTISFSSVSGINYTLLSSPTVNAPLSTWSVVGTSVVTGNGSTKSFTDSPAAATYYILVAY